MATWKACTQRLQTGLASITRLITRQHELPRMNVRNKGYFATASTIHAPKIRLNFMVLTGLHTFLVVSLHALVCRSWFWPRTVDLVFLQSLFNYHFLDWHWLSSLITHRGFVSPRWLRRMLAWGGAGSTAGWSGSRAAIHRRHHKWDKQVIRFTPARIFARALVGS